MDDFHRQAVLAFPPCAARASRWLSMPSPESAIESSEPPLVEPAPRPGTAAGSAEGRHSSVDLSRLQELADEAGSPRIVEELSLIFVEDMERRLESLREAADERGERKLLSVISFGEGRPAAIFGALRMAALAEKIEKRTKRGDLPQLGSGSERTVSRVPDRAPGWLDLEVFGIRACVGARRHVCARGLIHGRVRVSSRAALRMRPPGPWASATRARPAHLARIRRAGRRAAPR